MIAIVNLGPAPGNKRRGSAKDQPRDPLGEHLYQIRINAGPPLAVFTHARGDSLSTCLRKAADAYDAAHAANLERLCQIFATPPSTSQP